MASTTNGSTNNGIFYDKNGKKTFIPLENNPDVFNALVHKLGLSAALEFHDIYSIDEPALLALVPRPAHALVFIAPADVYHRLRAQEEAQEGKVYLSKELTYEGAGPEEPVVWFKQTIGHACGMMALLHSVANGSARAFVKPGSKLEDLLRQAVALKPMPRADLLYRSQALEEAHMEAAVRGDTAPPSSAEPNGYHFMSFTKGKDGHMYELDGSTNGPIDRGLLGEEDDLLSERALDAGVRRFTKIADGNLEFSMIALSTKPVAN